MAAFAKATGAILLDYKSGMFAFESQMTEVELRIQHSNSEALKVDRELFTLKAFFNRD